MFGCFYSSIIEIISMVSFLLLFSWFPFLFSILQSFSIIRFCRSCFYGNCSRVSFRFGFGEGSHREFFWWRRFLLRLIQVRNERFCQFRLGSQCKVCAIGPLFIWLRRWFFTFVLCLFCGRRVRCLTHRTCRFVLGSACRLWSWFFAWAGVCN